MKVPITLRLVFLATLCSALAVLAVGWGFAWHMVQSARTAQRSFLLSSAFAAATEIRGYMREQKLDDLLPEVGPELRDRIRSRLGDLDGEDVLTSLGIV